MNILILGAGQVGSTTAAQLAKEENNDVTVVDINSEKLGPNVVYGVLVPRRCQVHLVVTGTVCRYTTDGTSPYLRFFLYAKYFLLCHHV